MSGINHEAVKAHGDKGTHTEWNADHVQRGHHNCEQFQHLNHVLENRTTYPAGPVPGQIIFRSDFPNAFVWTGTMWVSLTPVATIVVAADGTGNFTTIQEGIDALPAGGGVVYVKEGTYTITAKITINSKNISIIGSGMSTKIQTTANITMMEVGDVEGTHLNKLYIYGDITKANNIGLYLNSSDFSTIRDCKIDHCGSHGVKTNEGTNNLFSGCTIIWNKGDGVNMDGGVAGGGVYAFSECHIVDNDGSGIYANDVSQILISDAEVSWNKNYGVYLTGNNITVITGNSMAVNYWDGIKIDTHNDVIINSNSISLCGFLNGGAGHGIMLITADDCNISNNTLSFNAGWDINISNAACNDTIVLGNRCAGHGAGAINDQGTGTELGHNKEG